MDAPLTIIQEHFRLKISGETSRSRGYKIGPVASGALARFNVTVRRTHLPDPGHKGDSVGELTTAYRHTAFTLGSLVTQGKEILPLMLF